MLCTLAALATGPRLKALRRHLAGALDLGLEHRERSERPRRRRQQRSTGRAAAEESSSWPPRCSRARTCPPPGTAPGRGARGEGASMASTMGALHGDRARLGCASTRQPDTGESVYPTASSTAMMRSGSPRRDGSAAPSRCPSSGPTRIRPVHRDLGSGGTGTDGVVQNASVDGRAGIPPPRDRARSSRVLDYTIGAGDRDEETLGPQPPRSRSRIPARRAGPSATSDEPTPSSRS